MTSTGRWTSPRAARSRPSCGPAARPRVAGRAPPSASGPTHHHGRRPLPHADALERFQMMAFLGKGKDPLLRDLPRVRGLGPNLQVQGRHRRLRQARQRVEGGAVPPGRLLRSVRGRPRRSRSAFQWNTGYNTDGITPSPTASTPSRGCTRRASRRPSAVQQVRQVSRAPQGQRRQPPGRGHPGGSHRHRERPAHRSPVRGPDQGQAREPHPLTGRAGHQRQARPVVGGEPHRGQPHRRSRSGRPSPSGCSSGP